MNAIKHWMLPVLMLLCAAGLNTACDELLNDEKEDGQKRGDGDGSEPHEDSALRRLYATSTYGWCGDQASESRVNSCPKLKKRANCLAVRALFRNFAP